MDILDLDCSRWFAKNEILKEMQIHLRDMVTDYFSYLRNEYIQSEEYLRLVALGLGEKLEFQPDEDLMSFGITGIEFYGEKLLDIHVFFDVGVLNVNYHEFYDYFDNFCTTHMITGPYVNFRGYNFHINSHIVSIYYENYVLLGMPTIPLWDTTQVNYLEKDTHIILTDKQYLRKPYMHTIFNHGRMLLLLLENLDFSNVIDLVQVSKKANVLYMIECKGDKSTIVYIESLLDILCSVTHRLKKPMYVKILYTNKLIGSHVSLDYKLTRLKGRNILVKLEMVTG